MRKLAAIEALSRYGRAQPKMLGSINLTPNVWPTAAVIDWLNILKRVDGIPDRAKRLDEANQILRGRLTYSGTTLKFSTEESDFWWWLMDSADANAARLILAVLDDPAWKDDLPRMVVGSLARQRRGAWLTTTANLWGSLALDKFAAKFESQKVAGATVAQVDLPAPAPRRRRRESPTGRTQPAGGRATLPWPPGAGTLTRRAGGQRQAVAHGAEPGGDPAQGAARAPATAIARSVSAVEQKDKARWSRGDIVRVRLEIDAQSRHDLGRRQRSGARRRDDPRLRPRPRLGARDARREARRQRLAGVRGAQLRGLPQLLRVPAARQARRRVHACASTTRAGSRCRRRGSRRCTRRRASASRRTRRIEVAP